jgi:formylglycine-generating enzyme required for sulfatase activity
MKQGIVVGVVLLTILLAGTSGAQQPGAPGSVFRDCADCPEMVVIGPGSFAMGEQGHSRETPVHTVTIGYSFAVGKYDVTFDEWDACVADGGCGALRPNDNGWGRGRQPVINVTWDDAQSYVIWLSRRTGQHYRLPSESEYEYVVRGGTSTVFWWGDNIGKGNAACEGCGTWWDDRQTAPVGSFKPNPFGVYDAIGNVTRWVQDIWHSNYDGAPADGSAWETGDPVRRVIRGGSWFNGQARQHAAFRNGDTPRVRNGKIGFRIVRTM